MPVTRSRSASSTWPARPACRASEPPEERPYGIDSAFRDPSGNQFRLTQMREPAAV